MRLYPSEESDWKEAQRIGAKDWMLEQLKFNPSYVHWGPHEDYMWKDCGPGCGWDAPVFTDRWEGHGGLDELNEVVNFYFSIDRDSITCPTCGGNGYHPDAQWISESFYRHSSPFTKQTQDEARTRQVLERFGCRFNPGALHRGSLPPETVIVKYGKPFLDFCIRTIERGGHWDDDITDDEALALVKSGRGQLEKLKTAEDFNAAHRSGGLGGHDAINRWILVEQRCKRLGVPKTCPACEGHASIWSSPECRLVLTLWVLHPRKGCSRGWEIKRVERDDLPSVYRFLREAAERNAARFAAIPAEVESLVKA